MAKQLSETLSIQDVNNAMEYYYGVHAREEDKAWKDDLGNDDDEDDLIEAIDVAYGFYEVMLRLSEFLGTRYWELESYMPEWADKKEDKRARFAPRPASTLT